MIELHARPARPRRARRAAHEQRARVGPLWRAKLPEVDDLFELIVDSAFVGLRKPDPAIYSLTLERLGGVRRSGACSWTTST